MNGTRERHWLQKYYFKFYEKTLILKDITNVLEESKHKHLTIKSWAEDDRPREKLVTKGRQSLSDAELLDILLASGNRNETAVQLAQRILKENARHLYKGPKFFSKGGESECFNIDVLGLNKVEDIVWSMT